MGTTHPTARPLAIYGPYGVFIHSGQRHLRGDDRHLDFQPRDTYSLWIIQNGHAALARHDTVTKVIAPSAILLPPEPGVRLRAAAATEWLCLRFDVVHVARRLTRRSRAFCHAKPAPQPMPQRVWGVEVPRVVPRAAVEACAEVAQFCYALWWRGDLDHARANARLGQWLAEYVPWAASPPPADTRGTGSLKAIDATIKDRLAGVFTAAQLAESQGYSRQHFSRRFRAAYGGQTPGAEIRRQRMDRACQLLRLTDMRILAIAHHCGYRSLPSFCSRFKKASGATPSRWRRENR